MGKRGGYKREPTLYNLQFEGDPSFDGLEVMAKSLPLKEFFALQKLQSVADSDPDAAEKVVRAFAGVLVSWNLTDEADQPVPASYDGLIEQEYGFVLRIFAAWMGAISSVPNLLLPGSNGGGTSPEPSIPMEVS
jgi:hypothetical protein